MSKNLTHQVVVIGGGPAGCAAAISALNSGCEDVIVIEKHPFGRHRIGEILLTQTVLEMKELGIADDLHSYAEKYQWTRKYAAAYVHGKDRTPWKVQNNHPLAREEDQAHIPKKYINPETNLWYTLMVRRHEFDESLREIAASRGAKFIHGSVYRVNMSQQEDKERSYIYRIHVTTNKGEKLTINPQFVIDATGQQAFIARQMKTRNIIDDWGLQARYSYFMGLDYDNAIEHGLFLEGANILSFEDGWAWIANLGRGITSAGIVSKTWDKEDNNYWEKLKRLPEYSTFRFNQAQVVDYKGNPVKETNFYAHPNYRYRSDTMRGMNWASCGDAAMFLDPLLSQGVTLAFSFGRQLGEIASVICQNQDLDPIELLRKYESSYISEMEVLNKVVSLWYNHDFSFDEQWAAAAKKISSIFGRDIGNDVEAFRWISNLENIHHIIRDRHDKNFLELLNNVNNIKMIHDFEKDSIIST